jgi:hypothetical protein
VRLDCICSVVHIARRSLQPVPQLSSLVVRLVSEDGAVQPDEWLLACPTNHCAIRRVARCLAQAARLGSSARCISSPRPLTCAHGRRPSDESLCSVKPGSRSAHLPARSACSACVPWSSPLRGLSIVARRALRLVVARRRSWLAARRRSCDWSPETAAVRLFAQLVVARRTPHCAGCSPPMLSCGSWSSVAAAAR